MTIEEPSANPRRKNQIPAGHAGPIKAKTITISLAKGGCSKTTVSILLAYGLAQGGDRVLLVDLDFQRAAARWLETAEDADRMPIDYLCLASAGRTLPTQLEPLAAIYDWIVLDCPPGLADDCNMATLLCSNACISPVKPGPMELHALADTAAMVQRARALANKGLMHHALITMDTKTAVAESVKRVLKHGPTPTMKASLGSRTAFARAAVIGSVPQAMGSTARTAADEATQMVEEVKAMFEGDPHVT